MSQYTDKWAELTTSDFKVGYTSTSVSGSNGSSGAGTGSGNFTCNSSFTYDNSTGTLNFSASSGSKTWGNYNSSNYTSVSGQPIGLFAVWLGTVNGK